MNLIFSRIDRGDHQRRVDHSIHRGCARPSCADRTPWRWAARHRPLSHRPPSQHDLSCSRHTVSLVAQSRSHSRAETAVTTNGESIARSTAAVPDRAALLRPHHAGRHAMGRSRTARHRSTTFHARGTACHSSHRLAATAAPTAVSARRVPRFCERVLSGPELEGGTFAARPDPTDGTGRQLLSSIAVSNALSIEHPAPRCPATADCSSWGRVPRSCERVLSAPE